MSGCKACWQTTAPNKQSNCSLSASAENNECSEKGGANSFSMRSDKSLSQDRIIGSLWQASVTEGSVQISELWPGGRHHAFILNTCILNPCCSHCIWISLEWTGCVTSRLQYCFGPFYAISVSNFWPVWSALCRLMQLVATTSSAP